jgi:hypothetical protein
MFVKPPGPRHTATATPQGLTIRIPPKRNPFLIGFLTIWLGGWFVGEIFAVFGLLAAAIKEPPEAAFLLVWLCGWTLGGAFALYLWLWLIKGCEVITVSPGALTIKRAIFDWGRAKHYDAKEIRHLRVAPFTLNPFDFQNSLTFWGYGGGTLAFDYGFKTFRFGAGLDEAEARIILETIADRFPSLMRSTPSNEGSTRTNRPAPIR